MSSVRTMLLPPPLRPGTVTAPEEEARHALRVLRLRPGEAVRVADGAGRAAEAVVAAAGPLLDLLVERIVELPPDRLAPLTVAVAPPKGDRWTDLVRSLTELGVGRIRPLICERGERLPANLERARRVAAEALKQCRRGWLPRIDPPVAVPALAAAGGRVIVCDPAGGPATPGTPGPTTLVVGPEGGLVEAELHALLAAGAERVRIAGPVLRIETAALAATAVWASAWEHAAP